MSNEFCSYPVSDCQLGPLLASYEQRIDYLQSVIGNLELDAILAEAQNMEDAKRIEKLKAREEAIVRAALERAADYTEVYLRRPHDTEDNRGQGDWVLGRAATGLRSIASDPAEVAAIIKKAGENNNGNV
jgi:hypothetical protein